MITEEVKPTRLDAKILEHLSDRVILKPLLGPRETGKTYMYQTTSPQAFVVSSGKSTPATLFYHKAWKRVGVIGVKDVVVFDRSPGREKASPNSMLRPSIP